MLDGVHCIPSIYTVCTIHSIHWGLKWSVTVEIHSFNCIFRVNGDGYHTPVRGGAVLCAGAVCSTALCASAVFGSLEVCCGSVVVWWP